ncbi:aspartate ammonia-lyase [Herbiconiux sp. KACC 21604]|uniref:aspartate ammonia-lyase n=1 Tax=unclassified Herbiconiux TaxID=2618217 RepID=UPI001491FEFA|nr:aspartate ammonia-lyase [Herbiconiux sp. SALV-R1]QJU53737.1 aspartate ammonia-lyase [Herbiconiux sp. SALV-R1]WPO84741.1 aspartate ammonia-lyase [Herbiconiux sp. KACC 21604]
MTTTPSPAEPSPTPSPTRTETDSLGSIEIPRDALWGIHTARALENFAISRRPISVYPDLVNALALVKQAAARANREIGVLDAWKAEWIDAACERIKAGEFHDEFVVGVIQGGAGTSTNMNANEVIANVALVANGHAPGDYGVLHPLDDVNRSQSTNDVYPTAVKLAAVFSLQRLLVEHGLLRDSFAAKGVQFEHVLKVGRTQLQDAVPMTLGQEFHGFATTLTEDTDRLGYTVPLLCEINLGATAIGTGITADPNYAATVCRHLRELTGLDLVTAADLVEATSDTGVFMTLSGVLKRSAIKLSKICNDLRLLSSGPQAGFGEINLPPRQAGSSIMPGKVNPVIPEVVNQVAFAVAGADVTITMAAEAGQLQLNAFEPVMAHSLLQSLAWMTAGCRTLRENCVDGITANLDRLDTMVSTSVGVVTALTPYIGYAAASALAKTALLTHRNIADLVVEADLMSREQVTKLTSPARLSGIEAITAAMPIIDLEAEEARAAEARAAAAGRGGAGAPE